MMYKEPESEVNSPKELSLEDKEFKLATGETVKIPGVRITKMRLFHGATTTGIQVFHDAEETTIGSGLYLTAQKDAAVGYAKIRKFYRKNTGPATLYEAEISDMNILTLTTNTGIIDFTKFFRQALFRYIRDELPKRGDLGDQQGWFRNTLVWVDDRLLKSIQSGNPLRPKQILMQCGNVAREILSREGYDGIMVFEGG